MTKSIQTEIILAPENIVHLNAFSYVLRPTVYGFTWFKDEMGVQAEEIIIIIIILQCVIWVKYNDYHTFYHDLQITKMSLINNSLYCKKLIW